jgi:hypothetical protein
VSNEIVFRASKGKALLILALSLIFVAIGYRMAAEEPLMGWLCVGFFALGIPASIMMMTSKSMYLRLDREGFDMVSPLKRVRVKWTDVDGFAMGDIEGAKMIQIAYASHYSEQKLGRMVAAGLSGMEGAIPNSYNASLAEILKTLNEWRARFGRQQ